MVYVDPKFPIGPEAEVRQSLFRLMHASRKRIMGYVVRQVPEDLRRLIEAEDIFQGVCFKASSQAQGAAMPADPDEALRWLLTIARRLLIDRVRELRTRKRGGDQMTDEEIRHESMVIMLEELAASHRTPSASAAAHEFLDTLERTLLLLPPDQQRAVRMRYVEGLSLAEVAVRMERSVDAVQKLAARGLAALRDHLQTASMYL